MNVHTRTGVVTGLAITALIVLTDCLFCTGCAGKDSTFDQKQQMLASTLDGLRQCNFTGDVDLNLGGSPLGVNYGGFASLGPQQSTLHIRGEVDFQKPPRAAEPPKPNP